MSIKERIDVFVPRPSPMASIWLFEPRTDAAKHWIEDNVESPTWINGMLACESRYVRDLIMGMHRSGLILKGEPT